MIPQVKSNLVFAKSRLAPKQKISLPRLELLAILIGTRATKFLRKESEVPFASMTIWSDSQCCLHWLHSSKPLSVFVENRLQEIKSCKKEVSFKYVPTAENPSDYATRGLTTTELVSNQLWWNGPKWLTKHQSAWPQWNAEPNSDLEFQIESEMKFRQKKQMIEISAMGVEVTKVPSAFTEVIDIRRFSSLNKLQNVTVLCLRFIKKLVKIEPEAIQKYPLWKRIFRPIQEPGKPFSAEEIEISLIWWIYHIQQKHFPESFDTVLKQKEKSLKNQLGLQLNASGLLECHGRIDKSTLPNAAKYPILLPQNDYFTELLIMDQHVKLKHVGTAHTLSMIRQIYWIPKGRVTVDKVIQKCCTCKKFKAKPFERPPMAQLPKERLVQERPFNNVGLDYMGPLYTKVIGTVTKVWICLFTCMVTRAIHLEVVMDMSSEQFLSCLRKFIARRGCPKMIISDNALQFKSVQKMLSESWMNPFPNDEVLNYCAKYNINWKFIPEISPWMGGFYERLIQMVKSCLKKSVGRRLLTLDQLQTLVTEIEACLNSRPLTFIYNDLESRSVLRPVDFLSPYGMFGTPMLSDQADESEDPTYKPRLSTQDKLRSLWSKSQICLDRFWEFFHLEYLQSLRESHKLKHKDPRSTEKREPEVGEIILISEPYLSRGSWKLAKVISLHKSMDGFIRSVTLKLPNKREIIRPVNLLHSLELVSNSKHTEEDYKQDNKPPHSKDNNSAKDTKEANQVQKYNLRPRKRLSYTEPSVDDSE